MGKLSVNNVKKLIEKQNTKFNFDLNKTWLL